MPPLSVEYNLVLEDLLLPARSPGPAAVRRHAEAMIERFDIRARPTDSVSTLSGGNMQKVLLARALHRGPRILVASQPTRGLDIGACRYVHEQLRELRDTGAACCWSPRTSTSCAASATGSSSCSAARSSAT